MTKKIVMLFLAGAFMLTLVVVASEQGDPEALRQLLVVRPGEGPKTMSGNEWKITGDQSGGRLAIMEINATAAGDFRDPHIHTREEEGWYVIEGELQFHVGEQAATAGPGTLVWAPRNVPHRYRVSKAPARYLLILSPAGMEGLFKEADEIRSLGVGTLEHKRELEKRRAKYGVRAGELPTPRQKP
jgi:mannose-6-phosphate isomerase-like protein (cupin superfamily)